MPTYEVELIALTREIESYRRKKRNLRKKLKAVESDLRLSLKTRKALLARIDAARAPDVFPSRLTNGATGYARPEAPAAPATPVASTTAEFVDTLDN